MAQQDRPVTLADVARRAGVSVPTASRALNGGIRGRDSGDPALRLRVREAAAELGYTPSTAAQSIKDGRSHSLAVIVNSIEDVGAAVMIGGIMHAAEDRGLAVAVRTTRDEPAREIAMLRQLRGDRPRAVIVATSRTSDAARERAVAHELELFARQGARVVVIGDSDLPFPRVVVDNRDAAAALARALVTAGVRRFALVSGPADEITAQFRLDGFRAGLREMGIEVGADLIVHGDFSRDGGASAVRALESRLAEIDLIAAMSDELAVGVIVGLREVGGSFERTAVAGFDGIGVVHDLAPYLSTVQIPLADLGRAAVAIALDDSIPDDHEVALPYRALVAQATRSTDS